MSLWTELVSVSSLFAAGAEGMMEDAVVVDGYELRRAGGSRWRQRVKSGSGNTVKDFARMLRTVSSRISCGLN